jgi:UDP-N-acetylglucosamine 2-epimerase (non-hydrolysing)
MKVLVVIGTRPEAIKMAPVIHEIMRRDYFRDLTVCLTAQHRKMLDQVIRTFNIPVHFDMNIMMPDQSIFDITRSVLKGVEKVIDEVKPDLVLVHGDTTTTLSATLAAFYRQIFVGHVEAGLRTYNKLKPFPEEMNRRLTDILSDFHYAPTRKAKENLINEKIPRDHIVITGNTVIDALLYTAQLPYTFSDSLLEKAGTKYRLILVTCHRRESFGEPLIRICKAIRDIVLNNRDIEVVYPVHRNPNVLQTVDEVLRGHKRVHLIEPLEYIPFVHLLKKATLVLTDSGGIQEEAPSLGKPVLVMRETTERPEAIEAGTAKLVGTSYETIVEKVQTLLDDADAYHAMMKVVNPYGDGFASKRIADHLESASTWINLQKASYD